MRKITKFAVATMICFATTAGFSPRPNTYSNGGHPQQSDLIKWQCIEPFGSDWVDTYVGYVRTVSRYSIQVEVYAHHRYDLYHGGVNIEMPVLPHEIIKPFTNECILLSP